MNKNSMEDSNIDEITSFFISYISTVNMNDLNINNIKSTIKISDINEQIKSEPKTYLNSVCVDVAEQLKNKNIFVIKSIKYYNYIYLLFDKLNFENMEIFKNKYKENKLNYFINFERANYFGIRVSNCNNKDEKEISNEFMQLCKDFKMQDIQRGYFNEKTFLMNICNCEKVEGINNYKKNNPQIVFDISKMDKSFKDYLKYSGYESLYLKEEHRIYLNEFYLNAHKKYLDSLK